MEWTCYKSINKVYIEARSCVVVSRHTAHHTRCWSSTKQTITWCCWCWWCQSLKQWIRHIVSLPPPSVPTNNKLGSWRPFQIEHRVSAIQAIITEIILLSSSPSPLSSRVSSWFDLRNVDNTPPPPTPAHLMVKLKRSWWFNLKQSRINSNLLAAHQAVWPRETLPCVLLCPNVAPVTLRLSSPLLYTAGGYVEHFTGPATPSQYRSYNNK